MKVVIMAGGKGTRISSVAGNIPKPMLQVGGKPVLEHELECLRDQGFRDLIITVGHYKNNIMDYFGDGGGLSPATGKPFGVQIEYYIEDTPLGNAGALFKLKEKLVDDFLLLNADVMFDVDIARFVTFHKSHGGTVSLFTHPNSHPYDSGLIITDEHGSVVQWLSKENVRPKQYKNRVNAGIHVLSPRVLDINITSEKVDLDRDILKPLAGTGQMFAYDSPEYVKDMGTPERYYCVCSDYDHGIISGKNLRNKQKAIFLDRDGTINKHVGFLSDIEEFELLPNVSNAIKEFNTLGYLVIVVTNQPVIARGEISIDQLQRIHMYMETLLGQDGAYLDGLYYCPHHPHVGFDGEIAELKVDCNCRKPKPGMLMCAAEDFNIDLNQSWMIGDSERDIAAGRAAGCRTVLIGEEQFGQDYSIGSLFDFVDLIKQTKQVLLQENL